jgi:hypothetical protein
LICDFISSILVSIDSLLHIHQVIVVESLVDITTHADHKSSIVISDNFLPISSVIKFAQVRTAKSFNISFFLSQNHGALIHKILNIHCALLIIIHGKASQSISSAIITKSLFPVDAICSNNFSISFKEDIFLSVINIDGFSYLASILSELLTIYGDIYQVSNFIHSVSSTSNQNV